MLIDFKVNNFRSFISLTEFSMETGSRVRKFKYNVLNFNKVKLLKRANYCYKHGYLEGRFWWNADN